MVNPNIYLKPWSKEEETRLLEMVNSSDTNRDWQEIATQLGTNRTPFHCFFHYQNRFNQEFKSRAWTKEEDSKLLEAVKRLKETTLHFTWGKVSGLINSRSSKECSQRYQRIGADRKCGRWSAMEDGRLVMAVDTLGHNWRKISKFIGKRTPFQCKERYRQCLNPELNFFKFTYKEDKKLLELYKALGNRWVQIAEHFKGRTGTMLKNRYGTMQKWRKETDWWNSLDDRMKNLLLGRNLSVRDRKMFEGEWQEFYNQKLGVGNKDYQQQILDQKNGLDPDLIPPRPPIHLKYSKFSKGFSIKKGASWSRRLTMHNQLVENLKSRLVLEHQKAEQTGVESSSWPSRGKGRKVLSNNRLRDCELNEEERSMKEVIDNTLKQTTGEDKNHDIPVQKIKSMMAALNLHFLGDSNIFVRDILQSIEEKKINNYKVAHNNRRRINLRLGRILCRNKWILMRGRKPGAKLMPIDYRSELVIQAEGELWDKCLPGLLMQRLGGDTHTLIKSIQEKISLEKKKKRSLVPFHQDSRYQSKVKVINRRLAEVNSWRHVPKQKKEKILEGVNRRLVLLRREWTKMYKLKHEMMQGVVEAEEKNIKFIEDCQKNIAFYEQSKNLSSAASSSSSSSTMTLTKSASVPQPPLPSLFHATVNSMLGNFGSSGDDNNDGEANTTYDSTLSLFPPCLATLSALRLLLLHRQPLMKSAGKLYKSDHYKRKRKHRLHIIINSDDDEEEEEKNDDDDDEEEGGSDDDYGAGGVKPRKKRRLNREARVRGIQFIAGDDDDDDYDGGGGARNGTSTGIWFESDAITIDDDVNTETVVDKELKELGNLMAQNFAPYESNSCKPKSNPNLRVDNKLRRAEMFKETIAESVDSLKTTQVTFEIPGNVTSQYEVLLAPASLHVDRMLKSNPEFEVSWPFSDSQNVQNGGDGEKHTEHDALSDQVGGRMTGQENPKLIIDQVKYEKGAAVVPDNKKEVGKTTSNWDDRYSYYSLSSKTPTNPVDVDEDIQQDSSRENIVRKSEPKTSESECEPGTSGLSTTDVSSQNVTHEIVMSRSQAQNCEAGPSGSNGSDGEKTRILEEMKKVINSTLDPSKTRGKPPESSTEEAKFVVTLAPLPTIKKKPGSNVPEVFPSFSSIESSQVVDKGKQPTKVEDMKPDVSGSMAQSINRIFEENRSQATLGNVVVVGMDPSSGKVVHFNDREAAILAAKKRAALEQEKVAESSPPLSLTPPEKMSEDQLKACMVEVRKSEEYQRLMARFKALFMWPVLLSTTQPETQVNLVNVTPPAPPTRSVPKYWPNGTQMGRKFSIKIDPERRRWRGQRIKEGLRRGGKQTKPVKELIRPRRDYSKILPKSERPRRQAAAKYSSGVSVAPSDSGGGSETIIRKTESLKDRKKGKSPQLKVRGPNSLPDWWKDAIAESMCLKKAIEEGRDYNIEVSINQDEDFVDKGDYSGDEWLEELKKEEDREKGLNGGRVAVIKDEEEVIKDEVAETSRLMGEEGGNEIEGEEDEDEDCTMTGGLLMSVKEV